MRHTATARLRGLDLLRACAIALVLMSHYTGFVAQGPVFGAPGAVGWAGVDLFFVLSGYLIGDQILAPVARGDGFSLKLFFARRSSPASTWTGRRPASPAPSASRCRPSLRICSLSHPPRQGRRCRLE